MVTIPVRLAGPEVVVTDRPAGRQINFRPAAPIWSGEIGIVAVGRTGPADVSLPADHSGRELRLACCLLVEIVRLRRRRGEDKRRHTGAAGTGFSRSADRAAQPAHVGAQLATRLEDLRGEPEAAAHVWRCWIWISSSTSTINWGTRSGDEVLREVARRLVARCARAGRWWREWEAMSSP